MLLYLHGFASGPSSNKARAFKAHLNGLGVEVEIPALDGGDFQGMTVASQLKVIEKLADAQQSPPYLVGSSMGAYLASLHASAHPVKAMVLMAPAFAFARRLAERYGEEALECWQRYGHIEIEHYHYKCPTRLDWDFYEDARTWPELPVVDVPTLVMTGRHDDTVPVEMVEAWVARTPSAQLTVYESDHGLLDVVDTMMSEATGFLQEHGLVVG